MYALDKIKPNTRTYLHVVGQLRDVDLEARGRGEGPKLGEVRAAEVDAVNNHHLCFVLLVGVISLHTVICTTHAKGKRY